MKRTLASFVLAVALCGFQHTAQCQSATIEQGTLDIHLNQNTSRDALAQIQKQMSAVGIGFRYDLIDWEDGLLKSIRMAVILPDGTMRRNTYSEIDQSSDIWIRLEGQGAERTFCIGNQCE